MATRNPIYGATLIILLILAPAASWGQATQPATLKSLVEQADKLSEKASALKLPKDDPMNLAPAFAELDHSLTTCLAVLLADHPDMDDLKKQTAGLVQWREWPNNITDPIRVKFQLNSDKRLQVNYRMFRTSDGAIVYVLQNSFWCSRELSGRICPSFSVIRVDKGKAEVSSISPESTSAVWACGYEAPCLLGFVALKDSMPAVAVLEGPSGSGLFMHVVVFRYLSQDSKWKCLVDEQYEPVSDYQFKDNTGELTITCTSRIDDGGVSETTTLNVAEAVRAAAKEH